MEQVIDYRNYPEEWREKIDNVAEYIDTFLEENSNFSYLYKKNNTFALWHFTIISESQLEFDNNNSKITKLVLQHDVKDLLALLPCLDKYAQNVSGSQQGRRIIDEFNELLFSEQTRYGRSKAVELCRKIESFLRALAYIVFHGQPLVYADGKECDAYSGNEELPSFKDLTLDPMLKGQLFYQNNAIYPEVDELYGLYAGHALADWSKSSVKTLNGLSANVRNFRNLGSHEGIVDQDYMMSAEDKTRYDHCSAQFTYNIALVFTLLVLDYRYDRYAMVAMSEGGRYIPGCSEQIEKNARVNNGIDLIFKHYLNAMHSWVSNEANRAFLGSISPEPHDTTPIDSLLQLNVCPYVFQNNGLRNEEDEELDPIELVFNTAEDSRLNIFTGPSGAGKSTLLLQLLNRAITEFSEGRVIFLPVLLPLRDVVSQSGSLSDILSKRFADTIHVDEYERRDIELAFDTLYKQHSLLILLDALDEIPSGSANAYFTDVRSKVASQISQLASDGHRIVLTSRYWETRHEIDDIIYKANTQWKVYHMHPLNEDQKSQLLTNCFSLYGLKTIDQQELKLRIANSTDLSKMASNPMHLMMMISILTQNDSGSDIERIRTGLLYRKFTDFLYTKNKERIFKIKSTKEEIEKVLIDIAVWSWREQSVSFSRSRCIDGLSWRYDQIRLTNIIEELCGMNLLRGNQYTLEFTHDLFRDFYMALYTVHQLHAKENEWEDLLNTVNILTEDDSITEIIRMVMQLLYDEEIQYPSDHNLSLQVAKVILYGQEPEQESDYYDVDLNRLSLLCNITSDIPVTSADVSVLNRCTTATDLAAHIIGHKMQDVEGELRNNNTEVDSDALAMLFECIAKFGKRDLLKRLFQPVWLGLWLLEPAEVASVCRNDEPREREKRLFDIKKHSKHYHDAARNRLLTGLASNYRLPSELLNQLLDFYRFAESCRFIFTIENIRKMYTRIFAKMSDVDRKLYYPKFQKSNTFLAGQLIFFIEDPDFFIAHFAENIGHISIIPDMLKVFQYRFITNSQVVSFFCRQCIAWADNLMEFKAKNPAKAMTLLHLPAIAIHTWLIKGKRCPEMLQFIEQEIDYLRETDYLQKLLDLIDMRDLPESLVEKLYDTKVFNLSVPRIQSIPPVNSIPYMRYSETEIAVPHVAEPLQGRFIGLQYEQHSYQPERWPKVNQVRVEHLRLCTFGLAYDDEEADEAGNPLPHDGKLRSIDSLPDTDGITFFRISPYETKEPYYTLHHHSTIASWYSSHKQLVMNGRTCHITSHTEPMGGKFTVAKVLKLSYFPEQPVFAQGNCSVYRDSQSLNQLPIDKSEQLPLEQNHLHFVPAVSSKYKDGKHTVTSVYYRVLGRVDSYYGTRYLIVTEPFEWSKEYQICQLQAFKDQKFQYDYVRTKIRRVHSYQEYPRYVVLHVCNSEGIRMDAERKFITLQQQADLEPVDIPFAFMTGRGTMFDIRIIDHKWVNWFADNPSLVRDLRLTGGLFLDDFPIQLQGIDIYEMDSNAMILELEPSVYGQKWQTEGTLSICDHRDPEKRRLRDLLPLFPLRTKGKPSLHYIGLTAQNQARILVRGGLTSVDDLWFRVNEKGDYYKFHSSEPIQQHWLAECIADVTQAQIGDIELCGVKALFVLRPKKSHTPEAHIPGLKPAVIELYIPQGKGRLKADASLLSNALAETIATDGKWQVNDMGTLQLQKDTDPILLCVTDDVFDASQSRHITDIKFFNYLPVSSKVYDFMYLPPTNANVKEEKMVDLVHVDQPERYHRDTIRLWINNLRATKQFEEKYIPLAQRHSCLADMLRYILTLPDDTKYEVLRSEYIQQLTTYRVKGQSDNMIILTEVKYGKARSDADDQQKPVMLKREYSPDQLKVGDLVIEEENRVLRALPPSWKKAVYASLKATKKKVWNNNYKGKKRQS